MAYIGLRKPYVAKYNRAANTYSECFKYSHAVSLAITPNYSEASLYGDDMQVEYERAFTNAAISMGTTSTPLQAASVVFGHQVDTANKKVIRKATDDSNYVGVGVIAPEKVDGENKFSAAIVISAKFSDSALNFTTKGESLAFATPTIEGNAIANDNGEWLITRTFDTENEAKFFVEDFLNYPPQYQKVTPAGTENPKALGWYEKNQVGTSSEYTYTLTNDTSVTAQKDYYERV